MDGGSHTDANARWVTSKYNDETPSLETQEDDPNSIYNTYRKLIHLKKNHEVLRKGEYKSLVTPLSILAFTRTYKDKTYLVLHNFSSHEKEIGLIGTSIDIIYKSHDENRIDNNKQIHLQPTSSLILEVEGSVRLDD